VARAGNSVALFVLQVCNENSIVVEQSELQRTAEDHVVLISTEMQCATEERYRQREGTSG
jgi:hypothetical protein